MKSDTPGLDRAKNAIGEQLDALDEKFIAFKDYLEKKMRNVRTTGGLSDGLRSTESGNTAPKRADSKV
jgi:hypothetical protein